MKKIATFLNPYIYGLSMILFCCSMKAISKVELVSTSYGQSNPNISTAALINQVGFKVPGVDSLALLHPVNTTYEIAVYDRKTGAWYYHPVGDSNWRMVKALDTTKITMAQAMNQFWSKTDTVDAGPLMTEYKAETAIANISTMIIDSSAAQNTRVNTRVKYNDTASMLTPYAKKAALNDTATTLRGLISSAGTGNVKYLDTAAMLINYAAKAKVLADSIALAANANSKVSTSDTTNRWYPKSANPSGYLTSVPAQSFASLTGKPTTLAGYGITDAYPLSGNPSGFLTSVAAQTWASITSKPTTISGYGITDGVKYTDTASMLLPYMRKISVKRDTVYTGTTDASGNYTVTFGTAYSSAPFVMPTIPNQSDKAEYAIVTAVSTTGFTVNVFTRAGVTTLPIIGSLGTTLLSGLTTNVASRTVNVNVKEK